MPVLLARRCDGRITGGELMRLITPGPHTRTALDDMKHLAARVRVPHGVRAWFEMHEADPRPRIRVVQRVLRCAAVKSAAGWRFGARRDLLGRPYQLHLLHPPKKKRGSERCPSY